MFAQALSLYSNHFSMCFFLRTLSFRFTSCCILLSLLHILVGRTSFNEEGVCEGRPLLHFSMCFTDYCFISQLAGNCSMRSTVLLAVDHWFTAQLAGLCSTESTADMKADHFFISQLAGLYFRWRQTISQDRTGHCSASCTAYVEPDHCFIVQLVGHCSMRTIASYLTWQGIIE